MSASETVARRKARKIALQALGLPAYVQQALSNVADEIEGAYADRIARLEAVATQGRVLVAWIQEWMRETGETLPREIDIAYLHMSEVLDALDNANSAGTRGEDE